MMITEKCSCQKEFSPIPIEDYVKKLKETSSKLNNTQQINCASHHKTYTSYCKTCKLNLCTDCISKHKDHSCVELSSLDIKKTNPEEMQVKIKEEINAGETVIYNMTYDDDEDCTPNAYIIKFRKYSGINKVILELINSIYVTAYHSPCF